MARKPKNTIREEITAYNTAKEAYDNIRYARKSSVITPEEKELAEIAYRTYCDMLEIFNLDTLVADLCEYCTRIDSDTVLTPYDVPVSTRNIFAVRDALANIWLAQCE